MLRHNRLNQLKKEKVTKDINFDNFSALIENKILMLAILSLKTYCFLEVIELGGSQNKLLTELNGRGWHRGGRYVLKIHFFIESGQK